METSALFVSSLPLSLSTSPTSLVSVRFPVRHVTRRRVRACIVPEELVGVEEEVPGDSEISDSSDNSGVSGISVAEAKAALYSEIGVVDRGFSATAAQHTRIISLVSQLENAASCEAPLEDPLIFGNWELLYTNALDIISLSLLSPVASITSIYQNVSSNADLEIEIVNVVNLQSVLSPVLNVLPIPNIEDSLDTRVEIVAKGTPRDGISKLLDLEIVKGKVTQERVPFLGTSIPEKFNSVSWGVPPWNKLLGDSVKDLAVLETTFLDGELRVARAGKTPLVTNDGVFLLRRVAETNEE